VGSVDGVHDSKVVLSQSHISSKSQLFATLPQLTMFWRTKASKHTSVVVEVE
jgi:hypothetical protein